MEYPLNKLMTACSTAVGADRQERSSVSATFLAAPRPNSFICDWWVASGRRVRVTETPAAVAHGRRSTLLGAHRRARRHGRGGRSGTAADRGLGRLVLWPSSCSSCIDIKMTGGLALSTSGGVAGDGDALSDRDQKRETGTSGGAARSRAARRHRSCDTRRLSMPRGPGDHMQRRRIERRRRRLGTASQRPSTKNRPFAFEHGHSCLYRFLNR